MSGHELRVVGVMLSNGSVAGGAYGVWRVVRMECGGWCLWQGVGCGGTVAAQVVRMVAGTIVVAAVPAHSLGAEAAVDLVGAARVDAAEHGALEARAAGGGDRDRGGHLEDLRLLRARRDGAGVRGGGKGGGSDLRPL